MSMILLCHGNGGDIVSMNFNHSGSRMENRAKRRKTNIILNTLITIVITLILIISWRVFFSGDKEDTTTSQTVNQESSIDDTAIIDDTEDQETSVDNKDKEIEKNESSTEDDSEKLENETAEEAEAELVVTESDEPNVEVVIIDPSWEPVGTVQTAGHESSYSKGTVDWNEKLEAAAYAIGTSVENMTAWWVTGGDPPEYQAILTVSERGNPETYRVTIEWLDGQGWKPVEMKKLIENDRKS